INEVATKILESRGGTAGIAQRSYLAPRSVRKGQYCRDRLEGLRRVSCEQVQLILQVHNGRKRSHQPVTARRLRARAYLSQQATQRLRIFHHCAQRLEHLAQLSNQEDRKSVA